MQASAVHRRILAAINAHSRWSVGPAPKQRKLAKGESFEDAVKGKTFTNPETGNKVKFNSLPDKAQKKLRQDWKKQKGGGDGDEPKGTRVDKKMVERAQDKARSNADDAFGSMFDSESLRDTLENLGDVTSQVREAFENLYHDIEDIVNDEGLTQDESTELWKQAYGALNDHVSGLLENASGELDEDDYFKLEDAAVKGIDETSGNGPYVDEDDEKDRQKALKKHLKKNKGGKQASDLRARLIRLAHENPKMRPHLLPLLSKRAGEDSPLLEVLLPEARWYRFMGMASQKSSNPRAYDSLLGKMYSRLEVFFAASASWAPVLLELYNYTNSSNNFDQDYLAERIRDLSNRVGADPNSGEMPKFGGYLTRIITPAAWFRFSRKQGSDASVQLNALLASLEKKLDSFFSSMPGKDSFWSLVALVDGNDLSESRVTPIVLKAALGLGLKSLVQDETMRLMASRQVSAAKDTAAFVTWALKTQDRISPDYVFKFLDRIGVPELTPSTNRRGQPFQVGEMVEVQVSKAPGHLQDILAPYDLRKGTIREVDGADVVVAFNAGSDIIRVPGGAEAGAKSGLYRTSVAGSDAGPHVEVVYVADKTATPTELSLMVVQQYVEKGLASGEERSPNYYTGYCRGYATGKDGTRFFGLFAQQRDGRPRTLNPSKGEVLYIGLIGRRPGNWKNEYEDLVASEAPLGE